MPGHLIQFNCTWFNGKLIWYRQLKHFVSSKCGILKDQMTFSFLCERWRFFSISLNNYLCHFIFCALRTSTCTCSACIPLAGARHRSSSHCRSTPSKQLAPRPTFSPRCLCSSVRVPIMQCSLLFHFLMVFLSNSALADEWVAIVYSFFSSLITVLWSAGCWPASVLAQWLSEPFKALWDQGLVSATPLGAGLHEFQCIILPMCHHPECLATGH